jgi:hypothetical protein
MLRVVLSLGLIRAGLAEMTGLASSIIRRSSGSTTFRTATSTFALEPLRRIFLITGSDAQTIFIHDMAKSFRARSPVRTSALRSGSTESMRCKPQYYK